MIFVSNRSDNTGFYATAESAGFDICASEDAVLEPGEFKAVPTGLFIDTYQPYRGKEYRLVQVYSKYDENCNTSEEIKEKSEPLLPELQIRPRSGLAFKFGVTVLNAPGTVDFDYPGEIKVILINHGKTAFVVKKGDRIAQGVVALVARAGNVQVNYEQRTGGFGSTGGKA